MYLYVYFVSNFNIILCFQKIIILQHKVCAGYLGLLTSLLKLRFLVNNFPLKFTISMELINDIHTFVLFIYAHCYNNSYINNFIINQTTNCKICGLFNTDGVFLLIAKEFTNIVSLLLPQFNFLFP